MRIDSSGNVGIGTSSPTHKLTVGGYSNVNAANKLAIGDNAGYQALIYMESANETLTIENTSDYASRATIFKDNGTERMRIDASGNVGIGTSSPTTRLHIYSTSNAVQLMQSATTSGAFTEYKNDTAVLDIGVNNSAGTLAAGVSGAYGSFLASAGAYPLAFGTNGTERMRISSSGDLSVGHAGGLGPIRISAISTVADYAMYLRNRLQNL